MWDRPKRSGGNRDAEKLRGADFLRNGLAVGFETSDVQGNGLSGALSAVLDRGALGETARERRDRHQETAILFRLDDDRAGPHTLNTLIARRGTRWG